MGTKTISSPQNVAGMLNIFFVEITDVLLNQNNRKSNAQSLTQRTKCCPKTMFLYPVTVYEIRVSNKKFKKANYLQIMKNSGIPGEKKNIKHKKPQVHIYNASLSSSIFPERLKTGKAKSLYKRGAFVML
jgi:hypothetical protein